MNSTAASGFVFLLLSVQVIQSEDTWGVTYTSTDICGVKGSKVEISCSYTYPSTIKHRDIMKRFWFTKEKDGEPVDLMSDSEYSGHVKYRCSEKKCSLTINNVRNSDKGNYKFMFTTNEDKYSGAPGVTLAVTDPSLQVKVIDLLSENVELQCLSSDFQTQLPSSVWYKNGVKTSTGSSSLLVTFGIADSYSCTVNERLNICSPPVYAPRLPVLLKSTSAEIVHGGSLTVTCKSDASPAASYTWYRDGKIYRRGPQLVFSFFRSSDSGRYYCGAENLLGTKSSQFIFIDVKYPPRLLSVSVNPSGEIVEGNSVTLNCESDAKPAATYTWYKKDGQERRVSREPKLVFSPIQSYESGRYYCEVENHLGKRRSKPMFINVKYPPRLPSVLACPSDVVEGSSVNLICSSDANPPASYTWYKGDEDSPKALGQLFIITNYTAEHSGKYSCEAQNTRGHSNSSFHLSVSAGPDAKKMMLYHIMWTLMVVLLIYVLTSCLWFSYWIKFRKRKARISTTESDDYIEAVERTSSLHFR